MSARGQAATLRLFVACELPAEVVRGISAWQRTALAGRPDVRANHALHLTLVFLGSLPEERVPEIGAVLAAIPFPAASVSVEAPAFLPARGLKRVVVLPLRESGGELAALQTRVGDGLARAGLYSPSARPWLPHVTVARFRRPGHPFPLQNVNIPRFGVVRMVLYSSLLERAGAVHTPLADFHAS